MFKKILFATTGTHSCDAAARVAFDLAKRYEADICTIHVFGVPHRGYSQTVTDIKTGNEIDVHHDTFQKLKNEIEQLYAKQIQMYKPCNIEVRAGIPHTEILRMARKKNFDQIIMGARSCQDEIKEAMQRHVAGHTLQNVARSAHCPVLIIGRTAGSFWGGISNIVFATDFSKASDLAFQFAYKLVKTFDCAFSLFHAIDVSPDPFQITKDQDILEDRLREARKKIRERYISQMPNFKNYDVDVWEGIPYVEVVKYARERYADLIVMAHHKRRMDPNTVTFGTTVEQVVLRSNCPVISVNQAVKINDKPVAAFH